MMKLLSDLCTFELMFAMLEFSETIVMTNDFRLPNKILLRVSGSGSCWIIFILPKLHFLWNYWLLRIFPVYLLFWFLSLSFWLTEGSMFLGLRGNGHAHCAGLWSNLQILDHLVMDQQVYFFSCFKTLTVKPGSFSALKLEILFQSSLLLFIQMHR